MPRSTLMRPSVRRRRFPTGRAYGPGSGPGPGPGPGRKRQTGAALLVTVLLAGLLFASSAVSLEAFLLTMRSERRSIDRLVEFHLVDTALTLCERHVARVFRPGTSSHLRAGEGLQAPQAPQAPARAAQGHPPPAPGTAPVDGDAMARLRDMMLHHPEPTRWRQVPVFGADGSVRWRRLAADAHAAASAVERLAGPSAALPALWPVVLPRGHRSGAPVCLIESWIDAPGVGRVLLLTAHIPAAVRAGGRNAAREAGTGAWLQSIALLTATRARRDWRMLAEPPTDF